MQDLPGAREDAVMEAPPDYIPIVSISKQLDTVLARLRLLEGISAQRSPARSPAQLQAQGEVSPARSMCISPSHSRPVSSARGHWNGAHVSLADGIAVLAFCICACI